MWQIAVFTPTQHEQFTTDRRVAADSPAELTRPPHASAEGQPGLSAPPSSPEAITEFSLHWSAAERCWRPASSGAQGPELCFRLTGDSVVVRRRALAGPLELPDGGSFTASAPIELPLPCVFKIDDSWFEVRPQLTGVEPLHLEPLTPTAAVATTRGAAGPSPATVNKWLMAASALHGMAASSPRFFPEAARLALEATGLDLVSVLVPQQDGSWQIAGSAVTHPRFGFSFHPAALRLLADEPKVWRRPPQLPAANPSGDLSAAAADSVVIVPVCDSAGRVIAALYGERHRRRDNRRSGIRSLEARHLEVIAAAVAAGMARRDEEVESSRQRILLEQAFPPAIADHVQRCPVVLAGRAREVTLLFAELKEFPALAEGLPAPEVYRLLAQVMDMLTAAVHDHGGVVGDYRGDGLSAMWNAPFEADDHADRACAAALDMLGQLPPLVDNLAEPLRPMLELHIGLHTGVAKIGDAGSGRRLHYGPRGVAVNIASHVQRAAGRLGAALLATGAVRHRLSSRFVTLRVCRARLPGLEHAVELFSVFPSTDALQLQGDLECYAAALEAFESGDFDQAEDRLSRLLAAGPTTPAVFLAEQTAALRQGALGRRRGDDFTCTPDTVFELLLK